ncbi:MAG: hypothetical protein HY074_10965 [Deltaproteobacteria bacterium]|nr:hypothetical protein [Deltaproteobacteria bacterium]
MPYEILENIKVLAKNGDFSQARARLRQLMQKAQLTRELRLELAYLANLSFAPKLALQSLHRFLRPRERAPQNGATDEERIEYAKALIQLGFSNEAQALLREIRSPALLPRSYRMLSLAYLRRWDFNEAATVLELLPKLELSRTDRIVSQVFLAVAVLHGQNDFARAETILMGVLKETNQKFFKAFHWDAWQVLAQVHYLQKNWAGTRCCLAEMKALRMAGPDGRFDLIHDKWLALMRLNISGTQKRAMRELDRVVLGFFAIGEWEQVRSCEYYRSVCTKDRLLLHRVYFGTPFPGFRCKLLEAAGLTEADLPSFHDFDLKDSASRSTARRIELFSGKLGYGEIPIRVLQAVLSDIYIAPRVTELHERVFPGEYFNPRSSIRRMQQAIYETRRWLRRQRIPLAITETAFCYRLTSLQNVALRIPLWSGNRPEASLRQQRCDGYLARINEAFDAQQFSAQDLARLVGISVRSARRYLSSAVAAEALERTGASRDIRYRRR